MASWKIKWSCIRDFFKKIVDMLLREVFSINGMICMPKNSLSLVLVYLVTSLCLSMWALVCECLLPTIRICLLHIQCKILKTRHNMTRKVCLTDLLERLYICFNCPTFAAWLFSICLWQNMLPNSGGYKTVQYYFLEFLKSCDERFLHRTEAG